VAVGEEILAHFARGRLSVVVELRNDVALVVGGEGLDLGPILAVALAEVDARMDLVRVVGRGAVAVGTSEGDDALLTAVAEVAAAEVDGRIALVQHALGDTQRAVVAVRE